MLNLEVNCTEFESDNYQSINQLLIGSLLAAKPYAQLIFVFV